MKCPTFKMIFLISIFILLKFSLKKKLTIFVNKFKCEEDLNILKSFHLSIRVYLMRIQLIFA
jgi:flagellar biogenesis protein FliO